MTAQSGDEVSAKAARYISISAHEISVKAEAGGQSLIELRDDIRSLAASVLRQDETRGIRAFANTMRKLAAEMRIKTR